MKNLCLAFFAIGLKIGICAQTSPFCYHPFEIANGQSQIIKRLHVTQATFNNTTRKKRNTEKRFYDSEGRDTLTLHDEAVSSRTIYDSLSLVKIQLHYDTKGNLYSADTTSISHNLEQNSSEVHKYDEQGRLVWVCQTLENDKPESYRFTKLFACTPQVDSIHFYYNSRNQIIKETFVVKSRQRHEIAVFTYNTKGLIRKLKYGDFTSRIKYLYK